MKANSLSVNTSAVILYLDMNSFFASCEQQDDPNLRNRPIGVTTHDSAHACVIAPSIEAKKYGVKTGMRLSECKALCPHIIPVTARPYRYRQFHVMIMDVLYAYCTKDEVMAKSIDEAVMNLTKYKLVYKDPIALAKEIKEKIKLSCGEFVKCSIGLAPNAFLAKLGTELQKPDGLIHITPENIDGYLAQLKLTDLPGIAKANEKRLLAIGIKTPLEMRHSSDALLRKAFGGVVGNYWYNRLNFKETDLYENEYRGMSATRTLSRKQAESRQSLESMLIALCTRLEQRLVKQEVFCKQLSFFLRYRDFTSWDTNIKLAEPIQDAMELRNYILERVKTFEQAHRTVLFNPYIQNMGVGISQFISAKVMQYSLFDNKVNQNLVRKAMYQIKDKYGKNMVRKASETIEPNVMRDAIGFGSVKDMRPTGADGIVNEYLLEESY
jgi:DNA polymerase-4